MPLKSSYVAVFRLLRVLARRTGILDALDKRRHRHGCLYLRSLFSIHDIEDLVALDLPWWTFDAAEHVDAYLNGLRRNAAVFEYGPGASTVWLAKRAGRIAYVEHDARFARVMHALTRGIPNASGVCIPPVPKPPGEIRCGSGRKGYEACDFADYVAAIRQAGGPFDLIVIDGRARGACLKEAIQHLKPRGKILFDNSARARYRADLAAVPMQLQRFRGLAPAIPYLEETCVLSPREPGPPLPAAPSRKAH